VLVRCPCKQAFTVHDGPFPRRIGCHTCGRKLIVVKDGPAVVAHEIRMLAVQVACPCGQPSTVRAEQFPMKIRCFKCGHPFTVLDSGDTIEWLAKKYDDSDLAWSAAIQDGRVLTEPAAICTSDTNELLREKADDAEQSDLARALKLIDSRWRADRERSALICIFDITIVPTKVISIAIGAVCIWTSIMLAFLFALKENPLDRVEGLAILASFLLMAVLGFYVSKRLYRLAESYEFEEAEWQRRRFAVIAEHSGVLSAR
jgi:ribosomal protein S27E